MMNGVIEFFNANLVGFVLVLILSVCEILFPLRVRTLPVGMRWTQNVALKITSFLLLTIIYAGISYRIAENYFQMGWGVFSLLALPIWLKWVVAFLVFDLGLYLWHRINHQWRFLWRFHRVHHSDLDMDFTTGIRFHFCEVLLSVPFQIALILIVGCPPSFLYTYYSVLGGAVLFHHANLRLPLWLEKPLALFVVTPRYHERHHSRASWGETHSHYCSLLTIWDVFFATRGPFSTPPVSIGLPENNRRDNPSWAEIFWSVFAKSKS